MVLMPVVGKKMGLSMWDLWNTRQNNVESENENIKGNVETMESNEARDKELVEDKGARVCIER